MRRAADEVGIPEKGTTMTSEERVKPGPEPARKHQLLEWLRENGGAEHTLGEIAAATGIPRRSVQKALRELDAEGCVEVARERTIKDVFSVEVVQ